MLSALQHLECDTCEFRKLLASFIGDMRIIFGVDWGEADMIQRRIRVVKWLDTTPALGVCTFCSREFKVPMNALKRTADAQANLQDQFDRHKCQSLDSSEVDARTNVLLRQEPDEEDDEEEDDRREEEDDDDEGDEEGDGYSE